MPEASITSILMNQGIVYALLAAALFGAGTPFAKLLIGQTAPLLLAGLLYLGSGIGLSIWILLRSLGNNRNHDHSALTSSDLPWLCGAIITGGILGPILLMTGLSRLPASSASLLLTMEGVLTTVLAWFVFREQFDRRIFAGMMLIVIASVLLSWEKNGAATQEASFSWGALCVVAACLCWAIDNNLTRKISANDAMQIAAIKGMTAGLVNFSIAAFWLRLPLPSYGDIISAGIVGFCSYGVSLVLFVLALRHLGTARTGAYFSTAPFIGAMVSLLVLREQQDEIFWLATAFMAAGIWLHLTEKHSHRHTHDHMTHSHAHRHDAHHQHSHDFSWDGTEPHTHSHEHKALTHTHPHFPDIHHRHKH